MRAALAQATPLAVPEEPAPLPSPTTFRAVVALASGRRPFLHAHLVHSVNLVRFEARPEGGRIELRMRADAPRDLPGQLTALLQEATGARWTVSLSNAAGEPTIAELGRAAKATRLEVAGSHPLVLAVMEAFPGAQIREVRDAALDAYGLPAAAAEAASDGEPVEEDAFAAEEGDPGFAPPDAEPAGMDRP